ncbi:MAG: hypothetical protein HY966_00100, partial [Ignavibacteriales bacterium]|nr:hypothetical protein [Ignavibacteriales bacterium]
MSDQIKKKFEELIATGTQLVPQGGFDFSGYNARLQNKYLEWRKSCLEMLEAVGPIGFPYKNKILGDQNGGFFFQSSAQLILHGMHEMYEKLKSSPDLGAAAPPPPVTETPTQAPGGARVLKPPPKSAAAPPPPQPAAPTAPANNKVYVVSEPNDPLLTQLSQFLSEIGVEDIPLTRNEGQMLMLDTIPERTDVRFAFFVVNSSDLSFAMFEIGHFVGKLGKGHV